jgi:membrane protease YdiL (CAAX protease family)
MIEGAELFYLQIAMFFGVTLSIILTRRFIDKRTFVSLGTKIDRWTFLDLFVGFAITFLMMGLIFVIEWTAGWVAFDAFAWQSDTLATIFIKITLVFINFILVGWNEELLSRGYHLQTLSSGLNKYWGIALSSIIFAIMHLSNPNSGSKFFVLAGLLLAGVFLAFGYLRTGQLWLPIGLHIGWNFFEGAIFGFPVSGVESYQLVRIAVNGPALWTGGAFGPEAGLVVIPGIILGFGLVYLYTHRRFLEFEDQG